VNASLECEAAIPVGARIGPNAITQLATALQVHVGRHHTRRVFRAAGLLSYLDMPPRQMVDERDVIDLYQALHAELGTGAALQVAAEAGRATARYLLERRIPRPLQWALRLLPAQVAAQLLLTAIRRHAWTFAGSGTFAWQSGRPIVLLLSGNPMCRGLASATPSCSFYAATFEILFRTLVHRSARVVECDCEAAGATACRFEVRWSS